MKLVQYDELKSKVRCRYEIEGSVDEVSEKILSSNAITIKEAYVVKNGKRVENRTKTKVKNIKDMRREQRKYEVSILKLEGEYKGHDVSIDVSSF